MVRPSTAGNRPAYLDNLFRDQSPPLPKTPSLRSANSSISFNSFNSNPPSDVRTIQPIPRPLSPAFEEDQSDRISLRSLKIGFSPRLKMRGMFNRRTYPQSQQVQEPMDHSSHRPTPSISSQASRRPSLPKLQTALSSPTRKVHSLSTKTLPPPPPPPMPEELKCQPCYYFAARHCQGYVMGGSHGDACEGCAQAGFFGAP